jgi:hypothetical protein
MSRLIFFTAMLLGPCYAILMGIVYALRLALPEGHVLYEQVDEYLWVPAILIALALAGIVATLTG